MPVARMPSRLSSVSPAGPVRRARGRYLRCRDAVWRIPGGSWASARPRCPAQAPAVIRARGRSGLRRTRCRHPRRDRSRGRPRPQGRPPLWGAELRRRSAFSPVSGPRACSASAAREMRDFRSSDARCRQGASILSHESFQAEFSFAASPLCPPAGHLLRKAVSKGALASASACRNALEPRRSG
jgi:hypothetical protein